MATVTKHQNIVTEEQATKIISGDKTEISLVVEQISKLLNICSKKFETAEVVCYKPNQGQKLHVDYYTGIGLEKQLEFGGNRNHTIILNLTSVEQGGIWFPWLQRLEKSELGKLIVIEYQSEEPRDKIESEYQVFPAQTERWTLVLCVRETELTTKYPGTIKNLNYYSTKLQNTELDIECGPIDDKRTLHIELPPNDKIGTGIVVGFTAGIDSSLLLYLLATINSYQTIPYIIQPVIVDNRLGCADYPENRYWNPINESFTSIIKMLKFIRSEIPGGMIQPIVRYTASAEHKRYYQTSRGLFDYLQEQNKLGPNRYVALYEAVLENIPELENPPNIIYDCPKPWQLPFSNIQKHHVIDIIIELGLENIFEITNKCPETHSSLTEKCNLQWQCMERRLGFVKLGKSDLGEKYLLTNDK